MLRTILVVLLLLWWVGFFGGFVTTSRVHLLLIGAVVILHLIFSCADAPHKPREAKLTRIKSS